MPDHTFIRRRRQIPAELDHHFIFQIQVFRRAALEIGNESRGQRISPVKSIIVDLDTESLPDDMLDDVRNSLIRGAQPLSFNMALIRPIDADGNLTRPFPRTPYEPEALAIAATDPHLKNAWVDAPIFSVTIDRSNMVYNTVGIQRMLAGFPYREETVLAVRQRLLDTLDI